MNSLFTVNNHVSVSLLSVTVTPSTFLTALVVILTFISLYLSFYLGPLTASAAVLTAPIRRLFTRPLAQQSQLVRKPAPTAPATIPLALGPDLIERRPLPALPAPEQNQDTALVCASPRRSARHARPPRDRPARRVRADSPVAPLRLPEPPLGLPFRGGDDRRRRDRSRPGFSFRRWLQSSGMAPPRKR